MSESLTVTTRHWDGHVHGRLPPVKKFLLQEASKRMCGGALEPNTAPKLLLTCDDVVRYLDDANEVTPHCKWVGSIFMTPDTQANEVLKAWEAGYIAHVKRYPPHGSTHSADAPSNELLLDKNSNVGKVLCMMQEHGIPFKSHGEMPEWKGEPVAVEEREPLYFREFQRKFRDTYPKLRIINAHLTTAEGVNHMIEFGDPNSYVCEITGHHLTQHNCALYDGGYLVPAHHCLPVLKDKYNWNRVRSFFAAGHDYVLGASDMAYHPIGNKFAFLVYGGIGTYHCSLELYVQALWELNALQHADKLLYGNAKRFYGKLVPDDPVPFMLVQSPWCVHNTVYWADQEHIPFGWHPDSNKRFEFQFELVA